MAKVLTSAPANATVKKEPIPTGIKITASMEVTHTTTTHTFDLEDLNLTAEHWAALTDEQKNEAVQEAVDELPETPTWVVQNFVTNDKAD